MDTAKLKKFAQKARRYLISQVSTKLTVVLAENSAARRESAGAVKKLEAAIESSGREQVVAVNLELDEAKLLQPTAGVVAAAERDGLDRRTARRDDISASDCRHGAAADAYISYGAVDLVSATRYAFGTRLEAA